MPFNLVSSLAARLQTLLAAFADWSGLEEVFPVFTTLNRLLQVWLKALAQAPFRRFAVCQRGTHANHGI